MLREPRECGGDHHQGVAAPDVIAARTPAEADALPCPGTAHDTTSPDQLITTHVLWPLTVVLGDIARRLSRRAREEHHDAA